MENMDTLWLITKERKIKMLFKNGVNPEAVNCSGQWVLKSHRSWPENPSRISTFGKGLQSREMEDDVRGMISVL